MHEMQLAAPALTEIQARETLAAFSLHKTYYACVVIAESQTVILLFSKVGMLLKTLLGIELNFFCMV